MDDRRFKKDQDSGSHDCLFWFLGGSPSQAPGVLPPQKRTQVSDAVRQAEYFNVPIVGKPLVQSYAMGEASPSSGMPLVHPGNGVTKQMWTLATGVTNAVARFPAALPNWVWARVLPCLDLHELVTMASCRCARFRPLG